MFGNISTVHYSLKLFISAKPRVLLLEKQVDSLKISRIGMVRRNESKNQDMVLRTSHLNSEANSSGEPHTLAGESTKKQTQHKCSLPLVNQPNVSPSGNRKHYRRDCNGSIFIIFNQRDRREIQPFGIIGIYSFPGRNAALHFGVLN